MKTNYWVRPPLRSTTAVFIHGILSDGDAGWTHPNGTYWPHLLLNESNSIGVYVFEYKTGLFSGTYRLGDVVDDLRNHLRLDEVLKSEYLIFVCHSMGGIVARRFIVQNQLLLIEEDKKIGLFLIASPSLGARYANWLSPLARLLDHTQADVLRFSQNNGWLMDLDRDFLNMKEAGRLYLRGKELVEDQFVMLHRFWRLQVVEPFAGARYFGDAYKVPDSNHFSIAKVPDAEAIQHRLLVEFIRDFTSSAADGSDIQTEIEGSNRIRFNDPWTADLVGAQLAVRHIATSERLVGIWPPWAAHAVDIVWPEGTLACLTTLTKLVAEAATHLNPTSIFHGHEPKEIADFISDAQRDVDAADRIKNGAGKRARLLVEGMLSYWTVGLDTVIARSLASFVTMCNVEILIRSVHLISRFTNVYDAYFPKEYQELLSLHHKDVYRFIFGVDEEICSARVRVLSGTYWPMGLYFWGPRDDVLLSFSRKPGDPIRGTWFDKYIIPQNEFRLLMDGSDAIFRYDEKVEIDRVLNSNGKDIDRHGNEIED